MTTPAPRRLPEELADRHVAAGLCRLAGGASPVVEDVVAALVRSTRQGSVVLRPDPAAYAEVEGSALAGTALVLRDGGVWLTRSDRQEQTVADVLTRLARDPVPVDRVGEVLDALWPLARDSDQREAAAVCLLSRVAVLAGGPGTGKTTTVARLLAALRRLHGPLRVALSAPTGKAAARLQESVAAAHGPLDDDERAWLAGLTAGTLHRLLGARTGGTFRHGRDDRLPHDLVVVDEASMVSLTMVARLLGALRPTARLLLVGDPDQLASVEAGAVLADITDLDRPLRRTAARAVELGLLGCPAPVAGVPDASPVRDGVARLTAVRRFGGGIAELAEAVRAQDDDRVVAVLRAGAGGVRFVEVPEAGTVDGPSGADEPATGGPLPAPVVAQVRARAVEQVRALRRAAAAGNVPELLAALDRHRLLCAHRSGPRGVSWWARSTTRWLDDELGLSGDRWDGLPLLVTANDPDTGLWNGDTGVVLGADAVFRRGATPLVVPLGRLGAVEPVHAMTVHRAQGSQFTSVTVVLPGVDSPLLTRETLYTAVTRAEEQVEVIGSEAAVRAAVLRRAARATGLRERLAAGG